MKITELAKLIADPANLLSDLAKMTVARWMAENLPIGQYETWYNRDMQLALIPPGDGDVNPAIIGYVVPADELELVEDRHHDGITFRMEGEPTAAEQKARDEARAEEEADWEVEDFFSIDADQDSTSASPASERQICFTPPTSKPLELAPAVDLTSLYWPHNE